MANSASSALVDNEASGFRPTPQWNQVNYNSQYTESLTELRSTVIQMSADRDFGNLARFIETLNENQIENLRRHPKTFFCLANVHMKYDRYSVVFEMIKSAGEELKGNEGDLINLWNEALYLEAEIAKGKPLTTLKKFRLRNRNPPPTNICPNGRRPTTALPYQATLALWTWVIKHAYEPYPAKAERHWLSEKTGLSAAQVKTWFANVRRRMKKDGVTKVLSQKKLKYGIPADPCKPTPTEAVSSGGLATSGARKRRFGIKKWTSDAPFTTASSDDSQRLDTSTSLRPQSIIPENQYLPPSPRNQCFSMGPEVTTIGPYHKQHYVQNHLPAPPLIAPSESMQNACRYRGTCRQSLPYLASAPACPQFYNIPYQENVLEVSQMAIDGNQSSVLGSSEFGHNYTTGPLACFPTCGLQNTMRGPLENRLLTSSGPAQSNIVKPLSMVENTTRSGLVPQPNSQTPWDHMHPCSSAYSQHYEWSNSNSNMGVWNMPPPPFPPPSPPPPPPPPPVGVNTAVKLKTAPDVLRYVLQPGTSTHETFTPHVLVQTSMGNNDNSISSTMLPSNNSTLSTSSATHHHQVIAQPTRTITADNFKDRKQPFGETEMTHDAFDESKPALQMNSMEPVGDMILQDSSPNLSIQSPMNFDSLPPQECLQEQCVNNLPQISPYTNSQWPTTSAKTGTANVEHNSCADEVTQPAQLLFHAQDSTSHGVERIVSEKGGILHLSPIIKGHASNSMCHIPDNFSIPLDSEKVSFKCQPPANGGDRWNYQSLGERQYVTSPILEPMPPWSPRSMYNIASKDHVNNEDPKSGEMCKVVNEEMDHQYQQHFTHQSRFATLRRDSLGNSSCSSQMSPPSEEAGGSAAMGQHDELVVVEALLHLSSHSPILRRMTID